MLDKRSTAWWLGLCEQEDDMLWSQMLRMVVMVVSGCLLAGAGNVLAQPSPAELADQIDEAYARHIRQIDRVTLTSEIVEGMGKGTVTKTTFEKVEKDGRPVLKQVQDADSEAVPMAGMHDGMLADMVRHARSVERDRHEGSPVYVVTVDDVQYLQSLEAFQVDEEMIQAGVTAEKLTAWLDVDDLIPRKMHFVQKAADGAIDVTLDMSDVRAHRGMPIAHRARMTIGGMEQMMSTSDLTDARRGMEQLKAQLEQMPPEHRAMFEAQLAPQLEQFEQMMGGGAPVIEFRVTDVTFD